MDITLGARDANSGRFNFVWTDGPDSDVSFDDTEAHAVVTSAIEEKGTAWWDENHGSDLRKMRNITSRTPSEAEATVLAAEQPLEQDGSILNVKATATREGLNRLDVEVSWTTPSGAPQGETV